MQSRSIRRSGQPTRPDGFSNAGFFDRDLNPAEGIMASGHVNRSLKIP